MEPGSSWPARHENVATRADASCMKPRDWRDTYDAER